MAVVIALTGLALLYFVGYRGYSRYITEKVFGLKADEPVPAHDPALQDGYDYVPTKLPILWGHHYTSIAGAAPIIGPAVAVIWGWVPALFWVIFGSIFIGAIHDFGALVLSARRKGTTMADLAGEIITPRVRILFQIIVYFLIWVVLAVFAFAIGVLFETYPESVIPVNFQIIAAVVIGLWLHRKGAKILIPSLIVLAVLYAMIGVGIAVPVKIDAIVGPTGWIHGSPITGWAVALILYSGVASVLPVWVLLQPRDYINSHQLVVGLTLLVLGLIFLHPAMSAPPIDLHPVGAPPMFPIIFITIACGAISGFHGLVSSGTTSKQLDRMTDARPIGYGSMLGEGALALIATLAVAAGLQNFGAQYSSWDNSGIHAIAKFVEGGGNFLQALWVFGTSPEWLPRAARALVAILAICFASTSMDTGARIQRLIVSELGTALEPKFAPAGLLKNRYLATLVAIGPSIPLVLAGPKVWAPLWLLFGTTNQLVGGLTLLVLFVYLFKARKPIWQYAVPMAFLATMTTGAMVVNLVRWIGALGTEGASASLLTIVIGIAILALEMWILLEAFIIIQKLRRDRAGGAPAEAVS